MLPRGLLKEYGNILSLLIRLMDMFIVFASGYLSYFLRFNEQTIPLAYLSAILVAVFFLAIIFSFLNIYTSIRGKDLLNHFLYIFQGICLLSLLLAGSAYLTKSGENFSRAWFILWMVLSLTLLISYRCCILLCLRFMRARGLNERRVIIFGANELGLKLAETVQQALWTGFHVISFIDDQPKSATLQQIPVIKTPAKLMEFIEKENIDELWLALPLKEEARVKEILHTLRHLTLNVRLVLDIFGLNLLNHSINEVAGIPVLNICSTPMIGANRFIKACEDRILSLIILLFISPLLFSIAIMVKLSSKGPIFYRQKRVGWNGEEFEMLKFRTMPVNAEEKTGPVWATQNDARPTKLGKFLRSTSLDELPQFINVLKGDMSIVGPRPERKVFVDEFKEKIPRYMQKHLVKAGITGWAQVHGWRGNTSLEKRIEYDLYYIEHWSLSLDLKIIFLTLFRGFVHRNAY